MRTTFAIQCTGIECQRWGFFLAAIMIGLSGNALAQSDSESQVRTNFETIQLLARQVGVRVSAAIPDGDSVSIVVLPKETAWYVEAPLLQGMKEGGAHVTTASSVPLNAEFGFGEAYVDYSNIRRDGFFGTRLLDRKVTVRLNGRVVDRRTGHILTASDFEESRTDTIALSDISLVENPNLPLTKGVIPGEGFFSNIAEPLIVLGAIAVAVFLLFNVRS